MNRKEKIEFLNGIGNKTRSLKDLLVKRDVIVVDENDSRPIIKAALKNNPDALFSDQYENLLTRGLVKGYVFDFRKSSYQIYSVNNETN